MQEKIKADRYMEMNHEKRIQEQMWRLLWEDAEDQQAHRLFTIRQNYQGPEIPEILKDVTDALQILDHPSGDNEFLIHSMLLPREFLLVPETSMPQYELTTLTEYIRERCLRERSWRTDGFRSISVVIHIAVH